MVKKESSSHFRSWEGGAVRTEDGRQDLWVWPEKKELKPLDYFPQERNSWWNPGTLPSPRQVMTSQLPGSHRHGPVSDPESTRPQTAA